MIRFVALVMIALVVLLAARMIMERTRSVVGRGMARRGAARPPGSREWDRRSDQVRRQLKGVSGPDEPREEIVAWVESHRGVEAYVEPKTMMSSLTVVLIDADGEWRRFPLREDRFLRLLAKERGVTVFDASRSGYPPRMRRDRPTSDDA